MRSKLFIDKPKTIQTSLERRVQIVPEKIIATGFMIRSLSASWDRCWLIGGTTGSTMAAFRRAKTGGYRRRDRGNEKEMNELLATLNRTFTP